MSGQYKVAWLCEALLVSRSGYYHWAERRRQPSPRAVETTRLRERIRYEFARSRQTYGSPRLAHVLGCPSRRNRISRLMRRERIFARHRSKYRPRTTDSRHGGPIAPNRLQNLTVHRPDRVWVTDATCILTGQGWLYLVAVLDIYTRSRHAVCQRRLPATPRPAWHGRFHESQRQLLRQRLHRILLEQP